MDATKAMDRARELARWGHVAYIYLLPGQEFYVTQTACMAGATLVGTYENREPGIVNP